MIAKVLAPLVLGFVSALVPVVNAETVQVGSSVLLSPAGVVVCVIALSVGQTGGKLVIFVATRRGVTRWRSGHSEQPSRTPAWVRRTNVWLLHLLSDPRRGPAAVAVSATVGLPPLALVSASAGASTMRCCAFGLTCLAGRLARFAVVAGGVTALFT